MKISSIILALCIGSLLSTIVFSNTQINDTEEIVGTWIADGGSFENRWVYHEDNTLTTYYKNDVYKTYSWTIRDVTTPSGLTLQELILTNTENPDDERHFQIDTLTDVRLILLYNTGVGLTRNNYFKH